MEPDFSDIERVEAVFFSLLRGHNLHFQPPGRIVTFFYSIVEIASGMVRILSFHFGGFITGEILYTLFRFEVIFYPEVFTFFVVPLKRMAAIAIHISECPGYTPVRK